MSINPDHSGKQDATAGCFSKFVLPPNHPNSHDWKLPIKAVWFESWEKSITFPSNKQFAPENWPGQKERIVSNRWFSMLVFGRVHRTMLAKLAAAAIPPFTEGHPTPKKCCFHALFFFQLFCWRPKNIQCPNDGNIVFHSFKNSPELQLFFFVFLFCWNFIRWSSLVVPSLPSAAPPQTWTLEDWFSTSESCKPSDWSTQNLSYQNSMASQKLSVCREQPLRFSWFQGSWVVA